MKTTTAAAELVEQLYHQYRKPLLGHLYNMVGDLDTAEDLLQETFLKVVARQEQVAGIEYVGSWLGRIATNTAHDHFRRQNRVKVVAPSEPDGLDLLDTLPADSSLQPGSAELDRALDVRAVLQQLPAHKRQSLLLHYCAGYSLKDIAQVMAVGTGTVRSRLFRARELFRQVY